MLWMALMVLLMSGSEEPGSLEIVSIDPVRRL